MLIWFLLYYVLGLNGLLLTYYWVKQDVTIEILLYTMMAALIWPVLLIVVIIKVYSDYFIRFKDKVVFRWSR